MRLDRKIGIGALIISIIIHFTSRMYCYCCVISCGILIMNIWDYLYIFSVLSGVVSILFIIGVGSLFEEDPT